MPLQFPHRCLEIGVPPGPDIRQRVAHGYIRFHAAAFEVQAGGRPVVFDAELQRATVWEPVETAQEDDAGGLAANNNRAVFALQRVREDLRRTGRGTSHHHGHAH